MQISSRHYALAAALWLAQAAALAQAPPDEFDLEPEIEQAPRYRIEFILFAHNDLDPGEELLNVVPTKSRFNYAQSMPVQREFDAISREILRQQIDTPILPGLDALETGLLSPDSAIGEASLSSLDSEAIEIAADRAETETEIGIGTEAEAAIDPAPAIELSLLPPEQLALTNVLNKLERLDAYTPLLHSGWEQNGLAEDMAIPIDLIYFGVRNPRGTLRLHMSRYLHIIADLAYQPPSTAQLQIQPPLPLGGGISFPALQPEPAEDYYLYEERRILRGQLNYFDHPALGILLQITLAPEPEPEPEVVDPLAVPSA